jgi:voltage-gated potassium channel
MSLKLNTTKDPLRQAQTKLAINLFLSSGLLLFGSLGYYLISQNDSIPGSRTFLESIYFTLVVLTTVGMEGPLSPEERYFSILLMLVGIFLIAALASNIVSFAIDGEINKHFGRRKLQKQINALSKHFIVVGFGRMGQELCEQLTESKQPFVVVELNEEKTELADQHNYLCIRGDATDEEILKAAGLDHAAGLATCLPHDPANVFVTLTAREFRPDMEIVARSEDPASESKLRRAGANRTICPAKAGARQLYELMVKPVLVDMISSHSADRNKIDFTVFHVEKLPKLIGKSIKECEIKIKTGMVVTAIERDGEYNFSPNTDMVFKENDKVYLMGPNQHTEKLVEHFLEA